MKKKSLSDDKNYLFESYHEGLTAILKKIDDFYVHVCDANITFVQVKNDRFIAISISQKSRLGIFIEYEKKGCYFIEKTYHETIVIFDIKKAKA